jgi:hypothetical protein
MLKAESGAASSHIGPSFVASNIPMLKVRNMRTSVGKKFGVRLTSSVQILGRLQREVIPVLEEGVEALPARQPPGNIELAA